jgi:hypothetical protein
VVLPGPPRSNQGRQDASVDAGELYGLPLDRFVAERNGLARRLRADGQREEAAAVAALRKPSVAAHGVNLLAHGARKRFGELFAAGDALRETQDRVLAGDADGRELARALERERAAVANLTQRAGELLAAEGHEPGAAVLERTGETLHAAALDDEARGLVVTGRLERELRHSGFGGGGPTEAVATPHKVARGKKAAPAAAATAEAEAKAKANAQARAAKAAKVAEAAARREAERTAKALRSAERDEERASEALRRAQDALSEARAQAESAAAAHAHARQTLDAF